MLARDARRSSSRRSAPPRPRSPPGRATPAPVRGQVIAKIGRLVEANAEALAQLVTREVGKPIAEARGEVQEIVDTCDFFLGEGRRLYGQTVPSEMRDKQLFTFRVPVGVAGDHHRRQLPGRRAVAGTSCRRCSAATPSCGSRPTTPPPSATRSPASSSPAACPPACSTPCTPTARRPSRASSSRSTQGLVNKVGFTGSSEVGARIGELAGRHLQSACLELGGKNPLVVMPDADLDLAAEGALFSGFGTAGQRCTSLGVAIVHDDVHDAFLEKFLARVEAAVVGDPTDPSVLYGPMLGERFLRRLREVARRGAAAPHRCTATGTGRITADNPRDGLRRRPGRRASTPTRPSSSRRAPRRRALPQRDLRAARVGHALLDLRRGRRAGQRPRLRPVRRHLHARRAGGVPLPRAGVSAGMLSVNNSTSGAEAHLPFGGNGKSGNGSRQSGVWVLDQFTRWQSMNWDYAGKLQKAQMDVETAPYDADFRL